MIGGEALTARVVHAATSVRRVVSATCMLALTLSMVGAEAAAVDSASAAHSKLRLSGPGEAVTISVAVVGAVRQPRKVIVSPLAATVDALIESAGGTWPETYRFAAMVLRADPAPKAGETSGRCLPLADLHASLLLRDDAGLATKPELVDKLLAGRLHRAEPQELVVGTERAPSMQLMDGDVLALPARTGTVYVAGSGGRVARLQHEPTLRAEEYVRQADAAAATDVSRHVLLYPDGRSVILDLEPWRYVPRMVPPGSLIAPAVDCLPGE